MINLAIMDVPSTKRIWTNFQKNTVIPKIEEEKEDRKGKKKRMVLPDT